MSIPGIIYVTYKITARVETVYDTDNKQNAEYTVCRS